MNTDLQGSHISFTANVQYVLIHSTLFSVLSIFLFTVLMRHDRSLLVTHYYIFRDILHMLLCQKHPLNI